MSEELLTIKEIARRINLPESNVRYYRDKFDKYLPSVGSGRKRRFKPEAMEVFEAIVKDLEQGLSSPDIEHRLAKRFSQNPSDYCETGFDACLPGLSPGRDISFFQEIMSSQATALEKMAESLKLERGLEKELSKLRMGCAKMKKALGLIWKKQKQTAVPAAHIEIDERIARIDSELESVSDRQDRLEKKMEKELGLIREELKKCQFWTKRMLMQDSSKKISGD